MIKKAVDIKLTQKQKEILKSFMGYVFQSLNRTREYFITTMVDRLIFAGFVLLLLFKQTGSFKVFVILYMLLRICAMTCSVYEGREIVFAKVCNCSNIERNVDEYKCRDLPDRIEYSRFAYIGYRTVYYR